MQRSTELQRSTAGLVPKTHTHTQAECSKTRNKTRQEGFHTFQSIQEFLIKGRIIANSTNLLNIYKSLQVFPIPLNISAKSGQHGRMTIAAIFHVKLSYHYLFFNQWVSPSEIKPSAFSDDAHSPAGYHPQTSATKNITFFPCNFFLTKKKKSCRLHANFFWTVPAKPITFGQIHNKHCEILLGLIFQYTNNPASVSQKWMLWWPK